MRRDCCRSAVCHSARRRCRRRGFSGFVGTRSCSSSAPFSREPQASGGCGGLLCCCRCCRRPSTRVSFTLHLLLSSADCYEACSGSGSSLSSFSSAARSRRPVSDGHPSSSGHIMTEEVSSGRRRRPRVCAGSRPPRAGGHPPPPPVSSLWFPFEANDAKVTLRRHCRRRSPSRHRYL